MIFTTFQNRAALTQERHSVDFAGLVEFFENAPMAPSKDACPWFAFSTFGDASSDHGSLKHAANELQVFGLVGDYDGEAVSIDAAADMARAAGLTCVFYTTPSHSPSKPRWRVVAPLARTVSPSARPALMDRLNGAMGGLLTGESWNAAQGFTFGRVIGREYRVIAIP